MAFGINRKELSQWKEAVAREEISYLTHFWLDKRFPEFNSVTKVGCSNIQRLIEWCLTHNLNPAYIHNRPPFPHYDLIGPMQKEILQKEGMWEQLQRFRILDPV
jgi:hypothetical protein